MVKNREKAQENLKIQAKEMKLNSNRSFPPAELGDKLRVADPGLGRSRVDAKNALFMVMSVTDGQYNTLANKYGTLNQSYTRNQFTEFQEKLVLVNDVSSEKKIFT